MNEPPALHLVLSPLVTLFNLLSSYGIYLLPAEDEDLVIEKKYYAIAIKRQIQSANGRGILIKPPLYCRLFIDKRTRNEGL